jgi:outer membrane murein-binding lipoprotein Lpp
LAFQWWLIGGAVLAAVAALARARHVAKRLERMSESYWELRYEISQLRARVNRLDPEQPAAASESASAAPQTAFVPLSSLKR